MSLYFGPFNDPVDTGVANHSVNPHPPDFHNAAFTLTRTTNANQSVELSISVAVRNTDTTADATANSVNLYAAACGVLSTAADVNQLASTVLTNMTTLTPPWLLVQVPAKSVSGDTFWLSPAVLWTVPAYASGFILIATLQTDTQTPGTNYATDPSVAIWLG